MSVAARACKMTIRLVNSMADTVVLTVILLLIAVGCYAIWDSDQVHQAASATQYEIYRPTVTDRGGPSFEDLRAINPEVVAWLTVYGTHIDYPVTQAADNMKYVNTSAMGRYSLSGAIFLDAACGPDFADFISILYGHHMEKQAMFGEIGLFADREYFEARRYGMLYCGGREYGLEFFAFVHTDAYNSRVYRPRITQADERQAYLDLLEALSVHTRAISVTPGDRIVLLSTCSAGSTNGRDILVGRITDEVYEDPYRPVEPAQTPRGLWTIDHLPGWWKQAPRWARYAAIGLPVLALILLLSLTARKLRRRKRGRR